MKIRFWVILALAGALLLSACAGKPAIQVAETNFDFGDVVNGNIVTRDIQVSNTGASDLVVDSVSSSCGCTTVTLEPMTIAPGGTAVLHIEYDSGAHGPELTGAIVRQVFIVSNDPKQAEALIEFTVNVLPPAP